MKHFYPMLKIAGIALLAFYVWQKLIVANVSSLQGGALDLKA